MMNEKLKRLEDNLFILSKFKTDYTVEKISLDKVDEWGLRYGIFESIQIVIDLACSLVAEKNLGIPKNYSDCILLLVSNNYIDKLLGSRLVSMVGLRNLIVHEYGIIDVQRLFEYLDHIQDIKDFVYAIAKR